MSPQPTWSGSSPQECAGDSVVHLFGIADARVSPSPSRRPPLSRSDGGAAEADRRDPLLAPDRPGWNDDPDTLRHVLDVADRAGVDALVFTGYYHKEENADYLRGQGVEVPYGEDYQRRKVLTGDLDAKVVVAWRDHGTSVPLFRKTRAGSPMPTSSRTTTATGACPSCATSARRPATVVRRQPSRANRGRVPNVLTELEYDPDVPFLVEDGHILTHALGEQRRYAIQHTLGYQVWEVDHPHVHRAHGRTLRGYELSDDERRQLDEARERLYAAARHEDD